MEITYTFILDQTGETIKVTDTTDWGVLPNPDRVDYALLCGVVKFLRNGTDSPLGVSNGSSGVVYSALFDNTERSEFTFDLGKDGYHYIRMIPIILDDNSSTTNGDSYYDTSTDKIYLRESNAWVEKTYSEMLLHSSVNDAEDSDIGVNPKLDKKLDNLLRRYEALGLPIEDKNFYNFLIGYSLMVGSIASLNQGAYTEYDRKIAQVTNLAKRW